MIYNKCDMARELIRYGFPRNREAITNWVCLIESESGYNTDAMNYRNSDGSWDWGLFQINDMYWCNPRRANFQPQSNGCNVDCSTLKSNLGANATCAKHIQSNHGFQAWMGWLSKCQGGNFDLSDCNIPEINLHGHK